MKTQCAKCKKWSEDYPFYHFKLEMEAYQGNKVIDEELLFHPIAERLCDRCKNLVCDKLNHAMMDAWGKWRKE